MSVGVVYASPAPSAPVVRVDPASRELWLESFDRSLVARFDNDPLVLGTPILGLDVAPLDVVTSTSPGIPGGYLDEIRTVTRPIGLPVTIVASTPAELHTARELLREILLPSSYSGDGVCRLVGSSPQGVREMAVAYVSGLEGNDRGLPTTDRFALNLLALDPYPRDREMRSVPFEIQNAAGVMVSSDPATAGPRQLGSSVVIGDNMPVQIASQVPVFPRLDFTGPFTSLTVTASTGMSVSVPAGVPAGQTLTIVTEPRAKSIRLNGALAAGRVARGSRLGSPFLPGRNILNVSGPGATTASRVVVSWRGGWRSLW